ATLDVVFFSSRRRHTRSKRDWSSDVCSSDLRAQLLRVEGIDDVRAGAPVEVVEDLDGFVLRQQSEDDRGFGGRELGDEFGGRIRPEIPDGGAEGGEIAVFGQRADCGGVED